jgi:hypothetical protein
VKRVPDWRGREVDVVVSAGGVLALANPWDNMVRTGVSPWPPPELLQKIYQSRQVRAFGGADNAAATSVLGFYSDLQSIHSEDAITWSVFGPVAHAAREVRSGFVRDLLRLIDVPCDPFETATVWLWRRLPHPDTLVPGGPEIDFGIQTDTLFLLGEGKWLSGVTANQGALGDKDQLTLRREFCEKYGRRLLPTCRRFVVLGVSLNGGMVPKVNTPADGVVEISLVKVATPEPKPEEVIVRMEASPINPSDQGLLFAGADLSTARASGTPENPVVTANIPPAAMKGLAGRVGQSMPVWDHRWQRRHM